MSLSRLPQVALRRLVPAMSVVPKNLDDDQVKKVLELQNNNGKFLGLPSKTEISQMSTMNTGVQSSSILTALSKARALNRLNLTGTQGVLSSQDLALLKAVEEHEERARRIEDNESLGAVTPEPTSPGSELADQEPSGAAGALDSASVDVLIAALRGTAAITDAADVAPEMLRESSSAMVPSTCTAGGSRKTRKVDNTTNVSGRALEEHNMIADEVDEAMFGNNDTDNDNGYSSSAAVVVKGESSAESLPPVSSELSAAERRKEQNRRAQKKFRQKDKVRQKEIKWRASQYDDLVATNKRFKRDLDEVAKERDMYRQILELHGIQVPGGSEAGGLPTLHEDLAGNGSALTMEQVAQDTFGHVAHGDAQIGSGNASPVMVNTSGGGGGQINDLLNTLVFGAVKADPMFGSLRNVGVSQPPQPQSFGNAQGSVTMPVSGWAQGPSPIIIDTESAISVGEHQGPTVEHQVYPESQFVDPVAFIDEILGSPSVASSSSVMHSPSINGSVSRKRSFDETIY